MSIDKTVIKISPIGFTQIVPNVANNVSQLIYNEGIYIKSDSLSSTLPKSVMRIYKNENNPKKIYLLSKDTSIIQAASSYISDTQTFASDTIPTWNAATVNELEANPDYSAYFSKDTDNLQNYSKFQQPSQIKSLDFEGSSLNGKTINFYKLTTDDEFTSLYSGSNSEKNDLITYGYFLKSKSSISDYSDDDTKYDDSFVTLFNSTMLQNFSKTSDLRILSDNDITLNKAVKISRTSVVEFQQYIDKTYSDIWIQKVDNDAVYVNGVNGSYVISRLIDGVWWPITVPNTEIYGSGFSFEDGKSITYLKEKNIFVSKNDEILSDYYLNRQLFKVPNSLEKYNPIGNIDSSHLVEGAIRQNTYDIFQTERKINLNSYNEIYNDGTTNRGNQVNDLNASPSLYLSTMYILNNDFDYRNYPFFPDDINTKVYEIELQEVVDFQNGTFVVVEIE